jgi:hypothetical protein
VTAAAIKIEGVVEWFGTVRQTRVMECGLDLDLNVLDLTRVVIDLHVGRGERGGKKRVFHRTACLLRKRKRPLERGALGA